MRIKNLGQNPSKSLSVGSRGNAGEIFYFPKITRHGKTPNTIVVPRVASEKESKPSRVTHVYINNQRWKQVTSFGNATKSDRVYVFDAPTGELTFGDGIKGRTPDSGNPVTVVYRHGKKSSKNIRATYVLDAAQRFNLDALTAGKITFRVNDDDDDD